MINQFRRLWTWLHCIFCTCIFVCTSKSLVGSGVFFFVYHGANEDLSNKFFAYVRGSVVEPHPCQLKAPTKTLLVGITECSCCGFKYCNRRNFRTHKNFILLRSQTFIPYSFVQRGRCQIHWYVCMAFACY